MKNGSCKKGVGIRLREQMAKTRSAGSHYIRHFRPRTAKKGGKRKCFRKKGTRNVSPSPTGFGVCISTYIIVNVAQPDVSSINSFAESSSCFSSLSPNRETVHARIFVSMGSSVFPLMCL